MGGPGTTNADADVVVGEVLLGELAYVLVEGRREQEIAMITILIGITSRHDLAHLFLPVIVEHLVSFVDDGVPGDVSFPTLSMQQMTYRTRPSERT